MKSLLQIIHDDSVPVGYVNILYTTYVVAQGVILTPVFHVPYGDAVIESDTSLSFAGGAAVGYRLT